MEVKFHYDLTGAEPIIRDVPLFNATTIVKGEFVMMQLTDIGVNVQFQTAYTGTGSQEMVDGLGICNETLVAGSYADWGDYISTAQTATTPAISSIATTIANGMRFGKCIINPFAVYLVEYDQTTGDDFACTATTAGSATYGSTVEDNCEGSWLYITNQNTTAGVDGQLRYINSSDGTNWTLDSALTTQVTTSDNAIHVHEINSRLTLLNHEATGFGNQTDDAGTGICLHVMESYIGGGRIPLEPLRKQVHKASRQDSATAKFYSDVVCTDHVYNMQTAA